MSFEALLATLFLMIFVVVVIFIIAQYNRSNLKRPESIEKVKTTEVNDHDFSDFESGGD